MIKLLVKDLPAPNPSCMTFTSNGKDWIMKLEKRDGVTRILFNRQDYPDACPDDFAKAVVDILESSYPNVSFEKGLAKDGMTDGK